MLWINDFNDNINVKLFVAFVFSCTGNDVFCIDHGRFRIGHLDIDSLYRFMPPCIFGSDLHRSITGLEKNGGAAVSGNLAAVGDADSVLTLV